MIDVPLPSKEDLLVLLNEIVGVVVRNKRAVVELNNQQAEALNNVFNAVLAVCTQVFRANLRGAEELAPILEELGVPRSKQAEVQQVFAASYLKKVD